MGAYLFVGDWRGIAIVVPDNSHSLTMSRPFNQTGPDCEVAVSPTHCSPDKLQNASQTLFAWGLRLNTWHNSNFHVKELNPQGSS